MIRETLAAGSKHAFMALTPGNGLAFQRRVATGGVSTHTAGGASGTPVWVRLVRNGNTITASSSTNGATWTQVGSDTVTMGAQVFVGLAVTSHAAGVLNTSTFDNVQVSGGSGRILEYAVCHRRRRFGDARSAFHHTRRRSFDRLRSRGRWGHPRRNAHKPARLHTLRSYRRLRLNAKHTVHSLRGRRRSCGRRGPVARQLRLHAETVSLIASRLILLPDK